jgi:tetratricopeptide (TPR) repeat protein
MTPGRRTPPWRFGLAVAALVGAVVGLEVWRDRVYGEPAPGDTLLYVRSATAIRRLSLSYAALLSDVYWVRAIQYYGGTRLARSKQKNYDLLFPLLDITTSLDPQFNVAYRFGAIFLAEPYPGGAGRPEEAIRLLEKGFRANPTRWQYLQDIGFVYYWWLGDFTQAAAWFEKGADVRGAPWWLRSLAATTRIQGGDRQGSRVLWRALAESEDSWVRNNAALRLAQLDALDAIDQLQGIVRDYASRTGRFPATWATLARAGLIRGVPLDPAGVPFTIDPQTGVVSVSPDSRLYPLPGGAQAGRAAR